MPLQGQLLQLTEPRRGECGAPPPPPTYALPVKLSFTRYVHGECKLSIYPDLPSPRARRTTHAVWGSVHPSVVCTDGAVRERRIRQEQAPKILDNSKNFQDDIGDISGYGKLPPKKIFAPSAKRKIKSHSEIAWRKYGKQGVFLTWTIPGSLDECNKTIAEYSGLMVSWFKQSLRDWFDDYSEVHVWEVQPKRGFLHLHAVVCSSNKAKLELYMHGWQARVNAWLLKICKLSRVDVFAKNKYWSWQEAVEYTQHDAGWLRKNPARYLCKYLTKESYAATRNALYHPSQWWGCDKKTLREANAEELRVLCGGVALNDLEAFCRSWFHKSSEFFEKIFRFTNPQFASCGGILGFTESEESLALVSWFGTALTQFVSELSTC